MKKFIKKVFIFILIIIPFLGVCIVKADSGWDSGYDSGGGYSGGGYSGGFDNDYDYDYHSRDNHNISSKVEAPLLFVLLVITILTTVYKKSKNVVKNRTGFNDYIRKSYSDMDNGKYESLGLGVNLEELKKLFEEKIVSLLDAYSNFDYETINNICSKKMASSYIRELDGLKDKNIQRLYKDIEFKIFNVIDGYKDEKIVKFVVYTKESLIDYKINKNGKVISGTSEYKITDNYITKFIYDIESKKIVINDCKNINKVNILE